MRPPQLSLNTELINVREVWGQDVSPMEGVRMRTPVSQQLPLSHIQHSFSHFTKINYQSSFITEYSPNPQLSNRNLFFQFFMYSNFCRWKTKWHKPAVCPQVYREGPPLKWCLLIFSVAAQARLTLGSKWPLTHLRVWFVCAFDPEDRRECHASKEIECSCCPQMLTHMQSSQPAGTYTCTSTI